MMHSVVSDLGLHCLPMTLFGIFRLKCVKQTVCVRDVLCVDGISLECRISRERVPNIQPVKVTMGTKQI